MGAADHRPSDIASTNVKGVRLKVVAAALALAGTVVAVVVFEVATRDGGGREPGGPVKAAEKNSIAASAPVAKRFAFGLPIAFNSGREMATLQGLRLLVMRVRKPGRYITRGVELDYAVSEKRYRQNIPSALAVCAMDRPIPELEKTYCDSPPSARGGI